MLTAYHLKKIFDLTVLFEDVSFNLNPGARTGLVGPNGCGKTTLMRILAGLEPPSSGHISRDPHLRIGYLPQGFEPDPTLTLEEIVSQQTGDMTALANELSTIAQALTQQPSDRALQ